MSATTTADVIREAAAVIRDPINRAPEDMHALADKLEEIALLGCDPGNLPATLRSGPLRFPTVWAILAHAAEQADSETERDTAAQTLARLIRETDET